MWGVQSGTPTTELLPAAADRAASSLPENKIHFIETKVPAGNIWELLFCGAAMSSESLKSISEVLSDVHKTQILSTIQSWQKFHLLVPSWEETYFECLDSQLSQWLCNPKFLRSCPQQPQAELFLSSQTPLAKLLDPDDHLESIKHSWRGKEKIERMLGLHMHFMGLWGGGYQDITHLLFHISSVHICTIHNKLQHSTDREITVTE